MIEVARVDEWNLHDIQSTQSHDRFSFDLRNRSPGCATVFSPIERVGIGDSREVTRPNVAHDTVLVIGKCEATDKSSFFLKDLLPRFSPIGRAKDFASAVAIET